MLDRDDKKMIRDCKAAGALFVTWDYVVREAAGGVTPYQAMDQASKEAEGKPELEPALKEVRRLLKLSPQDLTIMAEGADKTHIYFGRVIRLDRDLAQTVRGLRVDQKWSWRCIARYFSTLWLTNWQGNQLAGMVLCDKAAKLLGEDYMKPPWNKED